MCKWILSRGSERTLAGRTRGCGGLFEEEIQQVEGAEEKLESESEGLRLVEKLYDRGVNKKETPEKDRELK